MFTNRTQPAPILAAPGALAGGALVRCPACGQFVRLPRLLCRVRAALRGDLQARRLQAQSDPADPLRVQLRGGRLRRYRSLHARKIRQYRAALAVQQLGIPASGKD